MHIIKTKKRETKATNVLERSKEGEEKDVQPQTIKTRETIITNWGGVLTPAVGASRPNAAPLTLQSK